MRIDSDKSGQRGEVAVGDLKLMQLEDVTNIVWSLGKALPGIDESRARSYVAHTNPAFYSASGEPLLSVRTFIVKTPRGALLIDTCYGNHKVRETAHGNMRNGPFLAQLRDAGVGLEDVWAVFCSHFHPDHIGWNTLLDNGQWVPTFPRATYFFPAAEWEHWQRADESAWGYQAFADSVRPVVEAGLATFVAPGFEIYPGIVVIDLPGHTPGHAGLTITSSGATAIYTADMVHHPVQLCDPRWGHWKDFDPVQAARTRQRVVDSYVDTETLVLLAHAPIGTGGHLVRSKVGMQFVPNVPR